MRMCELPKITLLLRERESFNLNVDVSLVEKVNARSVFSRSYNIIFSFYFQDKMSGNGSKYFPLILTKACNNEVFILCFKIFTYLFAK